MRASRPEITAFRRRETRRGAKAPIVAGLLLSAAALAGLTLGSARTWAADAKPADAKAAPAPAAAPKATAPAPAPAKAAPKAAAPAKAAPNASAPANRNLPATPVAVRPSGVTPSRNPAKPVVTTIAPMEEPVTYQYNALGRRDPFQPMVGGTFIGDDVGGDAPPDVGGLKVVGVVWGPSDKFALVEDARGNSRVLRAGDKVMNGVVETLKREAVVVKMTVDGQTEEVTIPLTRKGDQTNANR